MHIYESGRDQKTLDTLVEIWEDAVRATHTFLTEDDIQRIKPQSRQALEAVERLLCLEESGQIQGFLGLDGTHIDMLFIRDSARGKGYGKQLLETACNQFSADTVDVNEQNPQAIAFYRHMGFEQVSRDAFDAQGNPFPILHLRKKQHEKNRR